MGQSIRQVGIIGCGWLGKALATALIDENIAVVATTTTPDKINEIKALGAEAELLSLPMNGEQNQSKLVWQSDALVIAIPPKLRAGQTDYPEKVLQIVEQAKKQAINDIILVSSTAAYEGHIGDVDESAKLKLNIDKVRLIAEAERYVLEHGKRGLVLRCAGLVGPKRHPGKFFSNGRVLSSPNSQVNLIHQDDVVGIILQLLKQVELSGVFNLVSDTQVTKKHYYSMAAQALGEDLPKFSGATDVELGKQVLGDKLSSALDYRFKYSDLVTWLFNSERESA